MRLSEQLNTAADTIETRGWTKGVQGWGFNPGWGDRPLCIEGGLLAASSEVYQIAMTQSLTMVDGSMTTTMSLGEDYLRFTQCPLYQAVREYLDMPKGSLLHGWNDTLADQDRVIEVLRGAALVEAAKENATVETKVPLRTRIKELVSA